METIKSRRIVRLAASILLIVLILLCVVGMILFGVGAKDVNRTGTFNLFGKSYHLNKSDAMSPDIEKNDLVVVAHQNFSGLKEGDLAAFYLTVDGTEHLLIRRIQAVNGIVYTLADNQGNTLEVSTDSCRFLGKAVSKSVRLGQAVLFLQTEDGRRIFLGWTLGVTIFLLGLTILIHVLWRALTPQVPQPDGPTDAITGDAICFDDPVPLSDQNQKN